MSMDLALKSREKEAPPWARQIYQAELYQLYYAVSKKTVEPVIFNSVCHHLTYWLKQKQIEEMTHNS